MRSRWARRSSSSPRTVAVRWPAECLGGAGVVLGGSAVNEQGIGAEDLVGKFRLVHELIEADREKLCIGGVDLRAAWA